ncbi:MAG: RNA polymerase factor sigma-54 [Hyphomicrobiaceae bacterium]
MALSAKLELRQSQQLVMTPQLQQAIKLLQLSNIELSAFVDTELERNPLLERDEDGADDLSRPANGEEAPVVDGATDGLDHSLQAGEATVDLDADYENVFPETAPADLGPDLVGNSWASLRQHNHSGEGESNLEAMVAGDRSLKDHLTEQLQLALLDPAERLIGAYLIDQVDESGYLTESIAESADKLGASASLIEAVLAKLQTFDPCGVFARDLKECLSLQLKEAGRFDPVIARFLDHLDLLAAHNLPALRRAAGVDMDDLADMIAEIKRLNPKPGLKFGSVDVQPVVPDVIVRPASDGSWIIELNSDTLPRVLVNRSYYTRVSRTTRNEKEKDFLLDCLQNANWLVKSLDQRARTILKVAEEIVRQQDSFLMHGVQYLRPLNLKTVADAIKMHESTVSRVTSNKYLATSRGIFELKYFFTSSIAAAGDGAAHSSEAVRHRIKLLIDAENPVAVLSDDKIVEILQNDGIDIARRTVAKYREGMRIASSVRRRREKRSSGLSGRAV